MRIPRSSTVVSDQKFANGEDDDMNQALEIYSASRRPFSAPNGLSTTRNNSMKTRRCSPRVSFAPTKNDKFHSNVQTQTCNVEDSKTLIDKSTSIVTNSATQTFRNPADYSKAQNKVMFPSGKVFQDSKAIQTESTFPRGREYNMDKYLDVTIAAISKRERYDKVRANSARGPRTQKSSEMLSVQVYRSITCFS